MSQTHILNLDKSEFRDDYVTEGNLDEFWQDEAREGLISRLQTCLAEAKHYAQSRADNPNETWLSHNAILVSGQRGTGKTVFLRNSRAIWKNANRQPRAGKNSLYFLDVIDPTMLINEDTFASVVIARIYSEVERHMRNHAYTENVKNSRGDKNRFTQALKNLADSLGKAQDFNGCTGIDKIQQYKSGIQIESFFHEFVEISIKILGCQAIVLRVDDVDMALERAFEVVDDVRRLLGCPYIIPIVSGDMRLYEHMTQVHFDDKSYKKHRHNRALINEGKAVTNELTTAYLTKVFPNQMRISLLPISRLINDLSIKQQVGSECFTYPIKEYDRLLFTAFYPLCHNQEILQNWPEPESSRELVQLVRTIPPSHVIGSKGPHTMYSPDKQTLWGSFASWAEQKKNGVAYTNAASYLTLMSRGTKQLFDIQKLLAFNPKMQMNKELYPWAKADFYKQQTSEINQIESEKDRTNNRDILDSVFNRYSVTLRSMPPLEFFDITKLYISRRTIKYMLKASTQNVQDKGKNEGPITETPIVPTEQLLLDVFTHGDFYSTLSNTYQFVFMSRAFELIAYSFLSPTADEENLKENILAILNRAPFYSIFNINKTKAVFADEIESDIDELEHNHTTKMSTATELSARIAKWHTEHKALFDKVDTSQLTALFAYMFNKTFTAFNLFKYHKLLKSKKDYEDEHLSDLVTRFSYMLLNSAYSAGIQGEAITANVAQTVKYETIRDKAKLAQTDRTLMRNKPLLELESQDTDSKKADMSKLALTFCLALEQHPIMTLGHLDKGKSLILGKYQEPTVAINEPLVTIAPGDENTPNSIDIALDKLLTIYKKEKPKGTATALDVMQWLASNKFRVIKQSPDLSWLFKVPGITLRRHREKGDREIKNKKSYKGKLLAALISGIS
ncbi:antiviral RADAR system adenosine triphosphatase RdrA [Pseudoalteromonas byunsanensis]|uniref:Uncharacterized protein n=1 Tax=Pseudoalteromonas byunsanensis TaxID=327939 RepID=A0A1S1N5A2_9GAMM|nr:antiviral RADAR system adenosine triphosphatase RdrA [Pseudoalteromonas byunsanensis]OHU93443.1 hypothetical protein BIW53_18970 [Pseudoalteromonas byunsanensis]